MPYLLFGRRVHRERVGRGQDEYVAGGFTVAFSVPEGLCGCAMLVNNNKITSELITHLRTDTHDRGWRKVYTSSGQQWLSTFSFHFTRDEEEQRENEMFDVSEPAPPFEARRQTTFPPRSLELRP